MNDTGTGCCVHVLSQFNRAKAFIARIHLRKRMHEADEFKLSALSTGDDAALQFVAFKAVLNEFVAQNQITVTAVNQGIIQFWMHIKSLVGRNRPRCGGPNDSVGGFVELTAVNFFHFCLIFIG